MCDTVGLCGDTRKEYRLDRIEKKNRLKNNDWKVYQML